MFLSSEILNLGISFPNTLGLKKENFTGRYSESPRQEGKDKNQFFME